ncbi:hypothetical protein EJB05_10315, partial [Eragrostis curvula]
MGIPPSAIWDLSAVSHREMAIARNGTKPPSSSRYEIFHHKENIRVAEQLAVRPHNTICSVSKHEVQRLGGLPLRSSHPPGSSVKDTTL